MKTPFLVKPSSASNYIQQIIDFAFPVSGEKLPHHHQYALYGAISRAVPGLHHSQACCFMSGIQLQSREEPVGIGQIASDASLRFRCELMLLPQLLTLSGVTLSVNGYEIHLGTPVPYSLQAHPELYARVVIIKGCQEPLAFLEAVNRQLERLGVQATAWIPVAESGEGLARRVLKIKGQTLVGYALVLSELTPEDSLIVQVNGIGGKSRMGAGFFQAVRPNGRKGL